VLLEEEALGHGAICSQDSQGQRTMVNDYMANGAFILEAISQLSFDLEAEFVFLYMMATENTQP